MASRQFHGLAAAALGVGVLIGAAWSACGQSDRDDATRLVAVLGVKVGSIVGEVGAGRGSLTVAMAHEVGPSGRVYSNDLDARRRDDIARAVAGAGVSNVTVVEGRADETNMPAACCDAVFMRDVFHHFGDRLAMSRSLLATLKPGGRLAVLDFPPRGGHGISPEDVRATLERAGFIDVRLDRSGRRWYLVVASRPLS
jgi:ubiquinone/menaquinone biosynthesis C-methylase UbiE